MTVNNKSILPVESIGTKIPAGLNDEDEEYKGGVVTNIKAYTNVKDIVGDLKGSFTAFPIDIAKYGIEELRLWNEDGTLADETIKTTYVQPEAEKVKPDEKKPKNGVWYGRANETIVKIVVANEEVEDVEVVSELEADYEAAIERAKQKAIYI